MTDLSHRRGLRLLSVVLACGCAALTACTSADDELARFIADTKKEPGGRVEPLPEIKPYETFVYSAQDLRSPFLPSSPGSGAGLAGQMYGLVETKDGLVHRVTAGNHMGQAEGKITDITPSKISLVEIVPDSLGGYMERPAALGLNE